MSVSKAGTFDRYTMFFQQNSPFLLMRFAWAGQFFRIDCLADVVRGGAKEDAVGIEFEPGENISHLGHKLARYIMNKREMGYQARTSANDTAYFRGFFGQWFVFMRHNS